MFNKSDFTICIDMDDTIENLLDAWCKWLNIKHNLNVSYEDVMEWDMKKVFPLLSYEEIYSPLDCESFWQTVTPKLDAVQYVGELIKEGFSVYICTASSFTSMIHKYKFIINKYFPFIDSKNIILCCDKQMVKCDVMIDDAPHNLEQGNYFKILFDAPHNKLYNNTNNNIMRCYKWEEIYYIIETLYFMYRCENRKPINYKE